MFLMSRVMSLTVSLIVSKVISCATCVVLESCKIFRIFFEEFYYSLRAWICIINHWSSQTDRKAARRSHVSLIFLVSNLFPVPTAYVLRLTWLSSKVAKSCVIAGFRRGGNEIFAFLECYAALTGSKGPTFQDNIGPISCPETPVTNCKSTLYKIPKIQKLLFSSCYKRFLSINF
jgi:hypothetical protein